MSTPKRAIKIFKTGIEVARAFAEELSNLISDNKGNVHIALSGGSTPAILFDLLAKDYASAINWEQVHFWWGDERCVAPTDNESNYKMANNLLFSPLHIKSSAIHRIKGELLPQEAANDYAEALNTHIPSREGRPVFDLIILGMGSDGHTASIFPNQMNLLETEKICSVATQPQSGQNRVTLTGKVINQAKKVCFLVTGEAKAKRIEQIMKDDPGAREIPAYYIRPCSGDLVFYMDTAAAKGITTD